MHWILVSLSVTIIGLSGARSQIPIGPLWSHVDNFGASTSTKIARDGATGLLYRALIDGTPWYLQEFVVQVFDTNGTDLTPAPPLDFQGITCYGDDKNELVMLAAQSDTLEFVMHYDYPFSVTMDSYWTQTLPVNGSDGTLIGSGATLMHDAHRDGLGTIVSLEPELRAYGPTGWPLGQVAVPGSQRIIVTDDRVYSGSPPDIAVVDRTFLSLLPSIAVPSSGAATWSTLVMHNGSIHYAAMNSNSTLDLGAVDTNGTLLWSAMIPLFPNTTATGMAVDAMGTIWVSMTRNNGVENTDGYLYGTASGGTLTDLYGFGRSMDDITTSGTRLFLTGQDAADPDNTYLIAFEPSIITGTIDERMDQPVLFPDPATDVVTLSTIPEGTISVTLADATGRVLQQWPGSTDRTLSMDVSHLSAGPYILRVSGGHEQHVFRFLVAH